MGSIYRYPLNQQIGSMPTPLVVVGDQVERGQLLAKKEEEKLGANLFSSVSGRVIQVDLEGIQIEESGTDFSTYCKLRCEGPLERIREAGIVGLGGAGFPTYVKMETKLSPDGVVLVNGAECEPILNHNTRRMEQSPEELYEGLKIITEILGVHKGIIGVKKSHQNAIKALNQAANKDAFQIKELEDVYPMGEERALIREALGILLPVDALPSRADALVVNAETVYRIREAVLLGKPLIDKDLTVAGKLADNGSTHVLLDVPLGMEIQEVIAQAGGIGPEYGEIIMGGPFTGKRTQLNQPVIKTTGGLLVAENFFKGPEKIGLLVCACGASEERLKEMADSMGSQIAGVEYCKQAVQTGASYKCENPGKCPGQVGKVMALKKAGAQALLVSNCTDCTNTVMSCAPQMGLPVYHCTDGPLRAVNHKLIRKYQIGGNTSCQ